MDFTGILFNLILIDFFFLFMFPSVFVLNILFSVVRAISVIFGHTVVCLVIIM